MQENHEDRELRRRFGKLREEIESFAPPYSAPEPMPRRTRILLFRPVPVLAMAAAVGAVALGLGLWSAHPRLLPGYDQVLWTGQTDFLLNTPGQDLLNRVPRIEPVPDLDLPGLTKDADSQPLG